MIWAIVALFLAGNGTMAEQDYVGELACWASENIEYNVVVEEVPRGTKYKYDDGSFKFIARNEDSMTFVNPVGEIVHQELYPRQSW